MKTTPVVIEAIRHDREQDGMSLYQIADRHGLSKSTVHNIIKGMDASKVKRASPSRRVVTSVEHQIRPNLSKTDLGEAARQMICARLMLNGVKVFRPMTEDSPTDLLALRSDGRVVKCQCKYMYPQANGSHFLSLYSIRKSGSNSKAVKHKYTSDEVDVFLGYCLDNDAVYAIPFVACGGRIALTVWISRQPRGTNGSSFDVSLFEKAFDLLK